MNDFRKRVNSTSYIILIFTLVLLVFGYINSEEEVPVHFNVIGQPDSWGSKNTVWIVSTIFIVLFIGLGRLSRMKSGFNTLVKITKENKERQMTLMQEMTIIIRLLITFLFLFSVTEMLFYDDFGKYFSWSFLAISLVLFLVIGRYMYLSIKQG